MKYKQKVTTRGMLFKKHFLFGISMFLENIALEAQRAADFLSIILLGDNL